VTERKIPLQASPTEPSMISAIANVSSTDIEAGAFRIRLIVVW
jgi:hypothetical protein